jgi:hypothetical protein
MEGRMSDTPTPRTDEIAYELHHTFSGAYMRKRADGEWVDADFARQLERDLAAANKALQEERERLDWMERNQWHGGTMSAPCMSGNTMRIQFGTKPPISARSLRDAIDAAMRDGRKE